MLIRTGDFLRYTDCKITVWYLTVFMVIIQIFSITSFLLAVAKEEDDGEITVHNISSNPDIASLIPQDAEDVELYSELGANRSDDAGANVTLAVQEPAVINKPVRWTLSTGGKIIKYRTPPAQLIEQSTRVGVKRVIVESRASVHYHNVTAFTNITGAKRGDIRLFWLNNGTRVDITDDPAYNLSFQDTSGSGLVDKLQWTVPRLSTQVYEVEAGITIINVQSYPTVGGNWNVSFNTSGTADLIITPVNGTGFGRDLIFIELWCGTALVNATYDGASAAYPGWNCTDEGKISDRVLTAGRHTLEFRFGNEVKYAYNNVESNLNLTHENITFVYSAGQRSEVAEAGEAKESINLTINAAIFNQGVSGSGTFNVLFYDGNAEFYSTPMADIAAGESANATGYWTTLSGTHNITVRVDPQNDTLDSYRDNNNASKLINVSAWQKYYGNITGNIILAASTNLSSWSWNNATSGDIGYVFIVKEGASINWSALWALGYRKDSATRGTSDFLDADNALNLQPPDNNATGFTNNNISTLFSTDGTNAVAALDNVLVQGRAINGVPVVNSTSMTNTANIAGADFITGILWDTSDAAGDEYTGTEDLVLLAKIHRSNTGMVDAYHDYEIAVPQAMRDAVSGKVDYYEELR
ncbi:MAG: hypothetical protein OIN66_05765 [Candidatus Methanoperedens sp.]|nr:hypothetical protein [Candidatus Methanoperedens sp.]